MSYFTNIWKNRYIIAALVKQDTTARYRGSVLGVMWTMLMPLGVTLIIGAVYTVLWQADVSYFIPYLFAGLTPWNFIVDSCKGGSMAYLAAEGYIKQLPVNLEIFPIRMSTTAFVNMLFGLLAYMIVLVVLNPAYITWWTFMILPALAVFYLLGTAAATIAATAQAYIRDYDPMQSLVLQGMFYVTPIIYDYNMMKARNVSFVYEYNPFFYFIQIMRDALMGQPAQPKLWIGAILILLVVECAALWLFNKTKRKIAFKL